MTDKNVQKAGILQETVQCKPRRRWKHSRQHTIYLILSSNYLTIAIFVDLGSWDHARLRERFRPTGRSGAAFQQVLDQTDRRVAGGVSGESLLPYRGTRSLRAGPPRGDIGERTRRGIGIGCWLPESPSTWLRGGRFDPQETLRS